MLKSALQEFMSGKAEGRMTYKQLQAKSPSKLDSIGFDRNIGFPENRTKIRCGFCSEKR
ncbi:MAG: hypothetical protein ACLTCP_13820 [Ruminococcus bicirculans (ex Wegman et al. 2014)]